VNKLVFSYCRVTYDATVRGSTWSPGTTELSDERNTSKGFCATEAVGISKGKNHPYMILVHAFIYTYQHMHTEDLKVIYKLVGHAVAQLVEAVRYKPEGRGFDSRWFH
jgi:hypothetical protein